MAKWFRSAPMEYISLIMNEDAAHDVLLDLGIKGSMQFTDVSRAKDGALWLYCLDPLVLICRPLCTKVRPCLMLKRQYLSRNLRQPSSKCLNG